MQQEEMEKISVIKRMPSIQAQEQGTSCLICMINPQNVITIPCNHLSMCLGCYTTLKNRHSTGESSDLKCPVCRTDIEPNEKIVLNY